MFDVILCLQIVSYRCTIEDVMASPKCLMSQFLTMDQVRSSEYHNIVWYAPKLVNNGNCMYNNNYYSHRESPWRRDW